MDTLDSVQVFRKMKRGGVLMLEFAPVFTAFGFSGQDGVDLLEKIRAAMWESKEESPTGGLMGGLITLYGAGEPPHPALDRILADILPWANTRSGIVAVLEEVVSLIKRDGKTDMTQPWRLCMVQVFSDLNKAVVGEQSALQELKSALRGVGEPSGTPSAESPDDVTEEEGTE